MTSRPCWCASRAAALVVVARARRSRRRRPRAPTCACRGARAHRDDRALVDDGHRRQRCGAPRSSPAAAARPRAGATTSRSCCRGSAPTSRRASGGRSGSRRGGSRRTLCAHGCASASTASTRPTRPTPTRGSVSTRRGCGSRSTTAPTTRRTARFIRWERCARRRRRPARRALCPAPSLPAHSVARPASTLVERVLGAYDLIPPRSPSTSTGYAARRRRARRAPADADGARGGDAAGDGGGGRDAVGVGRALYTSSASCTPTTASTRRPALAPPSRAPPLRRVCAAATGGVSTYIHTSSARDGVVGDEARGRVLSPPPSVLFRAMAVVLGALPPRRQAERHAPAVHGVAPRGGRRERARRARRLPRARPPRRARGAPPPGTAYFVGKLIWQKATEMLPLLHAAREFGGRLLFGLDVYGDGVDAAAIEAAFAARRCPRASSGASTTRRSTATACSSTRPSRRSCARPSPGAPRGAAVCARHLSTVRAGRGEGARGGRACARARLRGSRAPILNARRARGSSARPRSLLRRSPTASARTQEFARRRRALREPPPTPCASSPTRSRDAATERLARHRRRPRRAGAARLLAEPAAAAG